MADDTWRRYHSGRYGETKEFTGNEKIDKAMTLGEEVLEKTFEGIGPENAKKLRDKSRKALEDMGE